MISVKLISVALSFRGPLGAIPAVNSRITVRFF
jgi:hypothetical protein